MLDNLLMGFGLTLEWQNLLAIVVGAVAGTSFPPPLNPADPGPAFYPRLMAGGLVLFCLVTLARAFKNEPKPIGGEGDAWLGYLTALATLISDLQPGINGPVAIGGEVPRNKVALKGPLTNLVARGYPSPNVTLRSRLGLIANVRHARYFEGVRTPFRDVNLVVVREATEDTYANILKLTDGLFLEAARQVAAEYPDIELEDKMVDNMCMQLVQFPQRYDILLMPNVYGDIISDLAAGIAGSLGLGFGGNFGRDAALFEAVHGTAPDIAGRGLANPIAEILSAAMMLAYIGESEAAGRIERAVESVLREGIHLTADLGGVASTAEVTGAVIDALNKQ